MAPLQVADTRVKKGLPHESFLSLQNAEISGGPNLLRAQNPLQKG